MSTTNTVYVWTTDGLRLPGFHYKPLQEAPVCVVFVPGMAGNILENYFADVLGETLSTSGIGFLYAHNRSHSLLNDTRTRELNPNGSQKTLRIGTTFERFTESVHDIQAWTQEALNLGYQSIILMGHSLGAPKVIYFYHRHKFKQINALILASPADMVGLAKTTESKYDKLLAEAKINVAKNEPRKILPELMWDWIHLSSQTFIDLFEEGGPADVLPVLRNPEVFPELALVDVPIFALAGEHDDTAIRGLKEDLELIGSKATKCPAFAQILVPQATHCYDRYEQEFADIVLGWIQQTTIR